jgi:hypothetical protein
MSSLLIYAGMYSKCTLIAALNKKITSKPD